MRKLKLLTVAVFFLGCGGSSSQTAPTTPEPVATAPAEPAPAPAEPAPAPPPVAEAPKPPEPGDPTEVFPTYKKVFENDNMRILEVTAKPGDKIPLHKHPDNYHYVVNGAKMAITADGKTNEMDLPAGMAVFIPASAHSAENVGTTEGKIVVFEMKTKAPGPIPAAKMPKGMAKVVLDDEHGTVSEITFKKGQTFKEPAYPLRGVYVLEGGSLSVKGAEKGAKAEKMDVTPGMAMVIEPKAHTIKNVGKTAVKAIVVDVKP